MLIMYNFFQFYINFFNNINIKYIYNNINNMQFFLILHKNFQQY